MTSRHGVRVLEFLTVIDRVALADMKVPVSGGGAAAVSDYGFMSVISLVPVHGA